MPQRVFFDGTDQSFLFVCGLSSHSRMFHLYEDVVIAGEMLQILTYAWHSRPLSIEGSSACYTYSVTGHPFIMGHLRGTVTLAPFTERLAVEPLLPVFTTLLLLFSNEKCGITGILGCLENDRGDICVKGTPQDRYNFLNRKGFNSIDLQCHVISFAGWPGSVYETRVFRNSRIIRGMAKMRADFHTEENTAIMHCNQDKIHLFLSVVLLV